MHPVRLLQCHPVTLLEKQNIRHHAGVGVAHKGVVRQPDSAQQVGPRCQITADGIVLFVHCAGGCNDCHHAARAHQVKAAGNEVIMDQEIVAVISLIQHLVIAKGYIANRTVKETVRELHCLKALDGNLVFLVQLPGNPAGNAVQLHAIHFQPIHTLRHQPHKVADPTGRFQHITGTQPHLFQCGIHRLDHRGRGIKSVEGGASGLTVFFRGQRRFYLGILLRPTGVVRVKCLGDAAPTDKPGQHFLFLHCGKPTLCFQRFQQMDGVHVGPELGFRAACAKIIIGDVEVVLFLNQSRLSGYRRFFRCLVGLGKRLQRQAVFFPRRVDFFRRHNMGGQREKHPIIGDALIFAYPLLYICDQLHLFHRKVRVQHGQKVQILLASRIDHVHLFAGEILIGIPGLLDRNEYLFLRGKIKLGFFLLVECADKLDRFLPKQRIPHLSGHRHVLQTDLAPFKVHRIHAELPAVNMHRRINGQIVLSAQVFVLNVGAVLLFAIQADIFAFTPKLSGIVHPLVGGETRHHDMAALFQWLFQKFAVENPGHLFGIFAQEQVMPIQFKAYQGIGVFFLNGVVLVLGLQQHWLQRLLFRLRLLLLRLHFLRIRAMGLKGLPCIFQRIKRACRSGSHPQFLIKAIMVVEFPIGVPDDGNFFGIAVLHGCGRMVTGHNAILHGFFLPVAVAGRYLRLGQLRGMGGRFLLVACRLTAVHKVKQGKLPAGNAVQIRFFFRLLEDGKGAVHILMHLGQNLGPLLVAVKIQRQRSQCLIYCGQ